MTKAQLHERLENMLEDLCGIQFGYEMCGAEERLELDQETENVKKDIHKLFDTTNCGVAQL